MLRLLTAVVLMVSPIAVISYPMPDCCGVPVATPQVSQRVMIEHACCTVKATGGMGSGWAFGMDGGHPLYLTCAHVTEGAKEVQVIIRDLESNELTGQNWREADVIREDAAEDLAILRLKGVEFKPKKILDIYSGPRFSLGSPVQHCGSFLGWPGEQSLSLGNIAAYDRKMDGQKFYQVTCPAYPGSSGGPVCTMDGKVLGMLARGYDACFTFCIPDWRIEKWLKSEQSSSKRLSPCCVSH